MLSGAPVTVFPDYSIREVPNEPITPTREMRVPQKTSGTDSVPIIEVGPESENRQKLYLPESTVLAERWEVVEFLGEGGMSSVYKMRHMAMGRLAAAKVLHPHLSFEDRHLMRFQREAQAASVVNHQNVISIYDCGVTPDGRPFILMEYLPGSSLAEELQKKGSLPLDRALEIFLSICDGMAHAHEKGVVHRDLKPSNVMLVPSDQGQEITKVVDFGIARLIPNEGASGEEMHQLTQTGEVFGSPLYMSPEQCLGKHPDQRSDVYAMGCLMYEVLAGRPPLKGNSFLETMHMQMEETPKPFVKGGFSNAKAMVVECVVFKCLAKNPADRYGSMLELKRDLLSASGNAAFIGLWKTKAGRESFKRFGADRKKEIKFFRHVFILSVILLPLSLAILLWSCVNWKFETIPDGMNTVHLNCWSRPFAKKKIPPLKLDTALMAQGLSLRSVEKEFRNTPILEIQRYSKALNQLAQGELQQGRYENALKHFEQMYDAWSLTLPDEKVSLWPAILGKAKCLYFLGRTPEAERYFERAISCQDEDVLVSFKNDFLECIDLYGESLLSRRVPNYSKIAEIYKTGANWAISQSPLTKDSPKNYDFFFEFSCLEGECLRILGNPSDPRELALAAYINKNYSEGDHPLIGAENGDVNKENPDAEALEEHRAKKRLNKASPTLHHAKVIYSRMSDEIGKKENVDKVTNFQRLMYCWGRGLFEEKFELLRAKNDLKIALEYAASVKSTKAKEIEAQILKELVPFYEKSDPKTAFEYKMRAVDAWRSAE